MIRPLRKRTEQFSEAIESYLVILIASPVLLGIVLGSWVAVLQLLTGGSPLVAFALMIPVVFVVQYSVKFAAQSIFADTDTPSSVEALKRRYANGEITHAEFEARADRLLSVETAVGSAYTGVNASHTTATAEDTATATSESQTE